MTPEDFSQLITLIENKTGMTIPESNRKETDLFVSERTGKLECSFSEYLRKIKSDHDEYSHLIDRITINETYFFREEKQFSFLYTKHFPMLLKHNNPVTIWSSSCSSGEEPLSLYSMARSFFRDNLSFTVYASDISENILENFERGIYTKNSFRSDGEDFHPMIESIAENKSQGTGTVRENCRIKKEHLEKIKIQNINLFETEKHRLPPMDIIFLRNTLIYMNEKNKRVIIDNIVNLLKLDGILFLSISEIPLVAHPSLRVEHDNDIYYFRKIDPHSLNAGTFSDKITTAVKNSPADEDIRELISRKREARKQQKQEAQKHEELKKETKEEDSEKPKENRKESQKYPSDEKQGKTDPENLLCNEIALILNNETHIPSQKSLEEPARIIIKLLNSITQNDYSETEDILLEMERSGLIKTIPGLYNFFLGYLQYQKGENDTAAAYFRKALKAKNDLWPAGYFLVKLISDDDPEKERMIKNTIVEIENYIEQHRYDYQFLLEGFNARYFLLILKEKQAKDNNRERKRI